MALFLICIALHTFANIVAFFFFRDELIGWMFINLLFMEGHFVHGDGS